MLKRIAYRYDASKALVILMRVENQYISLDSQIHFLKKKNILPKKFESEFDPMEPLRKGLIAYMFSMALDIKGGVVLSLFGMSERYALKKLVYQGMMSSGNVKDIVSGEELISILTQAGNFKAKMREREGGRAKGMQWIVTKKDLYLKRFLHLKKHFFQDFHRFIDFRFLDNKGRDKNNVVP